MNLPFLISDKDWQELKPRDVEDLGRNQDLPPFEAKLLKVFSIADLRTEWACRQIVIIRNTVVVFVGLMILLNGAQIISLIKEYLAK